MINHIPNIKNTGSGNFFLLAGPCVVEGEQITFEIAEKIQAMTDRLKIPFIFKASYRKANRSRADSYTGMGDEAALEILAKVKAKYNLPIVTDIHESDDAAIAARV